MGRCLPPGRGSTAASRQLAQSDTRRGRRRSQPLPHSADKVL
jgi:hypothetical protein